MQFDFMTGGMTWAEAARLAGELEQAGFSGMLFTEAGSVPWMTITAAAMAAPSLSLCTGIAVAFPRSPMISAQIAWEMAENTQGRFRLGLGSQVRGHVVRRYSATWDKPAPQMKDYVRAFQACIRAFRREEKLSYEGSYYNLSLLPEQWAPGRHDYEDVKVDISAVGPHMCRVAGELCDGVHVHPMHSMTYIERRLLPALAEGAARSSRDPAGIDLIIPVFTVVGDTPEEREPLLRRAKTQIAFYGSTPNYAFQFDDLGFEGTTERLHELMRAGDAKGLADTISDEILDHFALIARWDDMADALKARYAGVAARVVTYLAREDLLKRPENLGKWGEIARAVRAA
jgi:probable F420-dependent oxidoreductase